MMELSKPFPGDWVERFAADRAAPLDEVGAGRQTGWVTARHLLDSNIQEETALYAGWVRLALRLAERKIPAGLLRAECRMEELAVLAAEAKPFLKAKDRAEIRRSVEDRLLPQMPPQLKAIPFAYKLGETHLYVTALPLAQLDLFAGALRSAIGHSGEPSTPETLGLRLKKANLRDVPGASFSPEMKDVAMETAPGREFLTWLWFKAETQNGRVALSTGQTLGVLIEGPLVFAHEGNGAHVSVLKKGAPENSMEAKTSLLSGKKLKEARLTFALDEEWVWTFGYEADECLIRSLKLPQSEGRLDAVSRFQERMIHLEQWREIFLDLFAGFTEVRLHAAKWKDTLGAMRDWIQGRPARR
jgi:hypothetical protein